MTKNRLVAAVVSALLLVAPASALAQSAGDQQYQDPLGSGTGSSGGGSGSSSSGSGSAGSGGGSSSPASAPSTRSNSGTSAAGNSPAGDPPASASGELPRTGGEPQVVAFFGLAFLIVGAGTRLALPRRI